MYLAVDVGGTKTLIATLSNSGEILHSQKFPTPQAYPDFLQQLETAIRDEALNQPVVAACVAMPGMLDGSDETAVSFGNLSWANIPIHDDIENIVNCPVLVENDAKLAGLSEAILIKDEFKKVLYITISTGIGYALIIDGVIDSAIADSGGRTIILEHQGKMVPWESFASGKAIVERYGKRASEIEDPEIWKGLAKDFAVGMLDLIAILQPEVIVIGGGVGSHFAKFEQPLNAVLKSYETPMLVIPPIKQAQHPEEAVIYGCYELIRSRYGTTD